MPGVIIESIAILARLSNLLSFFSLKPTAAGLEYFKWLTGNKSIPELKTKSLDPVTGSLPVIFWKPNKFK